MAPVVIMLVIIFWALAAFMRVEPLMTSGPTSAQMVMSATCERSEFGLQVIAAVLAPRARAYSTAPTTYGVRPEADMPIMTSLRVGRRLATSRCPISGESSFTSEALASALGPPAIRYCTCCGSVEKVAGHSEASREAMRPEEPA